ncbi:MAG: ABC transporter ATP-binding protein [Thermostichales cyanobacterium BF3_bins_165]
MTMNPSPRSELGSELALQVQGISKRFGELLANDRIDLTVKVGEIVAILGENGAGKTTLMNILFGHYLPDQGQVRVFGQPLTLGSPAAALAAGLGMVHQHVLLAENLSVLDNVILGTEPLWQLWSARAQARSKLMHLATELGLDIPADALVGSLSVGERQRVEILKVLYRGARILILDEPTAVLTPPEVEQLFATLRRMVERGLSILLISHKLQEVMAVSDRVVVLRQGRVVLSTPTATTTTTALAAAMVGHQIPARDRDPHGRGEVVLELQGVSGGGLREVSLRVHRGEIVGIAGVAGNGQTALVDVLCGGRRPEQGGMRLAGQVLRFWTPQLLIQKGVARIPEDRQGTGLIGSLSLWENWLGGRYREQPFCRWGLLRRQVIEQQAAAALARFEVRGHQGSVRAPAQVLSGGNQQKVILARELFRDPQLIVAHQPTQGLDVGAVAYVHGQLLAARQGGAGILLISEDLDELLSLADRIGVLYRGRLSEPIAREQATRTALGLQMAGQGYAS